jgi:hypothetical protein
MVLGALHFLLTLCPSLPHQLAHVYATPFLGLGCFLCAESRSPTWLSRRHSVATTLKLPLPFLGQDGVEFRLTQAKDNLGRIELFANGLDIPARNTHAPTSSDRADNASVFARFRMAMRGSGAGFGTSL